MAKPPSLPPRKLIRIYAKLGLLVIRVRLNYSGVGRGGGLWVLEHPPPPETYLLFSGVFAVSTPFVLDLDND